MKQLFAIFAFISVLVLNATTAQAAQLHFAQTRNQLPTLAQLSSVRMEVSPVHTYLQFVRQDPIGLGRTAARGVSIANEMDENELVQWTVNQFDQIVAASGQCDYEALTADVHAYVIPSSEVIKELNSSMWEFDCVIEHQVRYGSMSHPGAVFNWLDQISVRFYSDGSIGRAVVRSYSTDKWLGPKGHSHGTVAQ